MNNQIKLYSHNKEGYIKVKDAYESGENVVGIVHATGTGKTYISLELLLDNPSMKSLFVVPSNAIVEHIKETIEECGLSLERDFPNLNFCTYQSLTTKTDEELSNLDLDMLVLDEFHHIGAPVWGEKINTIVNTHPNMKIFGMTAYTVRDRGTAYERDMALPGGNELFSDKIVSTYDIYDAMCDGVLPIPNYKSAYLNLINEIYDIESDILDSKLSDELKKKYLLELKSCKEQIDKAPKAKDLIKENLKYNDKCIYFCPVNDAVIVNEDEILGTNDVPSIRRKIGLLAMEVSGKTILYETTSDMGESGLLNRDHFYNDTSFFRNEDVSNILRIMFAKNQYNEGVHAPGVTKVFMARQTKSDIVFFEQIGRALSVRGDIVELTEEYESKSLEELISLANSQSIEISKCNSKEEIIERLLAPTIIDLVGNIDFIRELKDNLKNRIKERQEKGISTKITRELVDISFDITVKNEDIFEKLQNIKNGFALLTIEQVVEEIYEIYLKTGKMPNTHCQERFNTGTIIGIWLRNKKNQETIKKIASEGNEKAGIIVEKLGWNFTIEQAIAEIYEIYIKTGKMPNTQCQERFSNGTIIGSWICNKNNQEKIIELAQQGNEKARVIVEKLGWNFIFTIEQVVEEIYEIYLKTGKMPNTNCEERFSNGSLIGTWLTNKNNQEKIIELAQQGNEKAKVIVDELKLDQEKIVLTAEQAVEEIYEIYLKTGKMPNTKCQERFSNGTLIGSWISDNKDKIKELAHQGNEKARVIVEKLSWNFTIEQVVEEIYEIYLKTGKMPNTKCQERFSNGTLIGIWLNQKNNQVKIKELANNGNKKAKVIEEKLNWNFTIEQAVEETYEIYLKTGKIPNTMSKERFSTGKLIGKWLNQKNNQEKILELSQQGNEKARVIVEKLSWNFTIEQVVEEIYEIYIKTGKMPNSNCEERFSNGKLIKSWISKKNNQEKILELSQQGNEKARVIVEKLGWNFTIEQAVEEIYEIYLETGKMPNTKYQERFSNGTMIGIWLIRKNNQAKIEELAQQGNEKAKLILVILDNKNNKTNIEQLCNEYNIDYKKNKKYIDRIPCSLFKSMLNYFIDNNISYVDDKGILISDFYMSSKDFESKYGISIIELLNRERRK